MTGKRLAGATAIAALATILVGCGTTAKPAPSPSSPTPTPGPTATGQKSPVPMDATLVAVEGESKSLREVLGDRVAVIDFWATWCKPCRQSLPKVQGLSGEYPSDRLLVIGVNVGEDREKALAFARELGLTFPIYLDPDIDFVKRLGIVELPALMVLDKDGAVAYRTKTLDPEAHRIIAELLGR